ncbi:hypothetical protein DOY81_011026 [Sarcophaga bullata]|nr:hypothetical protein DOY81_011026 [Sarcophaga bullata]
MILVSLDAQKGIQTQTAECIVIGELLQRKLIVAVNKIDLLNANEKDMLLKKLETKLRKTLAATSTICTGTIVQGNVNVNDNIELPLIKEQRKIKSLQMFRSENQYKGSHG